MNTSTIKAVVTPREGGVGIFSSQGLEVGGGILEKESR